MGDVKTLTEKAEVTAEFIAGLYRQHRVIPFRPCYLRRHHSGEFCGCPMGILAGHVFGFAAASDTYFSNNYKRDIAEALGISPSRLYGIEAGFCWPDSAVENDPDCDLDNVSEYRAGCAIGLATYKILMDLP